MKENINKTNQILTEKEVSELLKISVKTLQSWRHQSKNLPYFKIGRTVKYKLSDIREYLESVEQKVLL